MQARFTPSWSGFYSDSGLFAREQIYSGLFRDFQLYITLSGQFNNPNDKNESEITRLAAWLDLTVSRESIVSASPRQDIVYFPPPEQGRFFFNAPYFVETVAHWLHALSGWSLIVQSLQLDRERIVVLSNEGFAGSQTATLVRACVLERCTESLSQRIDQENSPIVGTRSGSILTYTALVHAVQLSLVSK